MILAGFTHAPVVELSERLAALAPPGLGHAFYGSDGASAVEIALKMAFHYWKNRGQPEKTGFASVAGGYHGETLGALAVTDVRALSRHLRAAAARRRDRAEPRRAAAPRRASRRATSPSAPRARSRRTSPRHHATTAALIVEPLVQGAAGMAMYDAHYLARARALCTRYDVLLIADEIMTGFGRTGTMFAWEQARAPAPDFLCLSKGLTGGYLPLSCVLTTDAVYDAFYADDIARGVPAFAFVHRQRARVPRGARRARHLPRRRRDRRQPGQGATLGGARRRRSPAHRHRAPFPAGAE